ncbi:MAG: hypothetical protein QF535_07620, partial [Anaerolineales bacterium]|nr:hypothetical protein [Anaerolineales bacterium]
MKLGVPRHLFFALLLIALVLVTTNLFNTKFVSHAGFLFYPSFTEHTVDGSFNGAADIYASDLDGDGDMDILGAASLADDITWWANDGSENFTKVDIDSSFDGARAVHA